MAPDADSSAFVAGDVLVEGPADDARWDRAVTAVAPLRIDLTGGFTDTPPFNSMVDSVHISAAIDMKVCVRCKTQEQTGVRLSFSRRTTAAANSAGRLRFLAALQAAVAEFALGSGLHLLIDSDAPAGSGLGSSGAILVAAICGCAKLTGIALTEAALARKAITAASAAGIVGGQQDEFAAAHGSVRTYIFSGDGPTRIEDLATPELARNLEDTLLVLQMGASGRKVDVVSDVVAAVRRSDQHTIGILMRLQEYAQALYEFMRAGNLEALPQWLARIREAQLALHPDICCPAAADTIAAVRAVVPKLEYKILGGGGAGSCVLLYVPPKLIPAAAPIMRGRAKRVWAVKIRKAGVSAEFTQSELSQESP